MNNFDNFFDNLLPLRPLFPFVQSVLPTVFDDSLSYLETLGKVVKALNDTESNVNTLEQAVRAFADDLALYGNLTISPVEITYNQETGRYTASMTYADIVSAIEEGHTMVMHVVDWLHNTEYYTATMKITETGNSVKVLYWESPAFTVNGVTVFYEPFINENDVAGVTTRTITGSGGGVDAFIIKYDSDAETADKTFAEIVAAIEAGKPVALIADQHYIGSARWTTSGNDEQGYEIISVDFTSGSVITAPSGYNWAVVTYAVNDTNTWSVDRHGFPDTTRVNALIDTALSNLGQVYAVQYVEQSLTSLQKAQARNNIAAGHYNVGVSSDETLLTLVNLETNDVETYNINKSAPFLITVSNPSSSNPNYSVNKTAQEIRNNLYNLRLRFGLNEGVTIDSYRVTGSYPMHNIVFTAADPAQNSVVYLEYTIQVYYEGAAPTPEADVPVVTAAQYTHNIGSDTLKATLLNLLIPILRQGLYGTDQEAEISALETALGGTPPVQAYVITNNLTNVTNSNEATAVNSGAAYIATLTPDSGMMMQAVTVTMGGVDVTASVYSNGTISIPSVTGNIVITATAENVIETYTPTMTAGFIVANGAVYESTSYKYTSVIPCRAGDKVYGTCSNSSYPGSVVRYIRSRWTAAYDNNNTVIPSAGSDTQADFSESSPYVVPSGVYGVVFTTLESLANDVVIYVDKSERTGS